MKTKRCNRFFSFFVVLPRTNHYEIGKQFKDENGLLLRLMLHLFVQIVSTLHEILYSSMGVFAIGTSMYLIQWSSILRINKISEICETIKFLLCDAHFSSKILILVFIQNKIVNCGIHVLHKVLPDVRIKEKQ